LAQFLEPVQLVAAEPQKSETGESSQPSSQTIDSSEPSLPLYADEQMPVRESKAVTALEQKPEKPKGTPFSVPAAPALRTQLDLSRSLRPLMRKVPSRTRFDLDEDATVTQIAETQVWMPVVKANPERWLELDLVVEASKTTVIWERAIAELNHLVEYQGAFRAIRTWRLSAQADKVQLFPRWRDGAIQTATKASGNQRPHTPRELIDPTGRRLIWLVTDCTSMLWRQDLIYETILEWAKEQPIAIVQLFPERLWSRTTLRDGHIVRLGAFSPGLPSAQLEIEGLPQRLERRSHVNLVTVPIITPDAKLMLRWAKVASGSGESRTPGRAFDLDFIRRQVRAEQSDRSQRSTSQRTAQERVALFRSTTSRTVQQLANLMAASPVSLPVIDLLREAFRADFEEEVQQSHVAEVLLSGLLQRCDTEDEESCRYEFFGDRSSNLEERVRDILLGDASVSKSIDVLNVLSASICQKIGSPVKSFQALLSEMQATEGELRDAALPFARVGLDVLRRLGGEYAALAHCYDLDQSEKPPATEPGQDNVQFPDLETFEFINVQLIDELESSEFTITTLQPRLNRILNVRRPSDPQKTFRLSDSGETKHWVSSRQTHRARRFLELLPDNLTIEMVAIPGGTFDMGSPRNEPERRDSEGPQHTVTIAPFFMSRYPITQSQWLAVADMPEVQRSLNPDLSHFKDNDHPVERVSWWDAVEFCERLSVYTGQVYRLPSEAEWEYACRAGTTTPFHFGNMITTQVANYSGISTYSNGPMGERRDKTTPVNIFDIANAFGLSDMHGNV
jgi:hypothetical protein